MAARTPGKGARRLAGWGFEGQSFPPSPELLGLLRDRLGEARPMADHSPQIAPPAPRSLPDLGCEVASGSADRLAAARGQGFSDLIRLRAGHLPAVPDGVARPVDAAEVENLLRAADRAGLRVVPRGGGTSVTGGVNVLPGEAPVVVVSLERLTGLRSLDETSRLAVFGAGTAGPELEAALSGSGLTLGHFPQSWELSTLGGWIVTRSSGQESLAYGRIEEMVAGLELVAPAGRIRVPDLPATAAGPDLRRWVAGSEGRFGILTQATVRLRPLPAAQRIEAALLPSWPAGAEAVRRLARRPGALSLLRLSDAPETEVAMAIGLARRRFAALARRWLSWRGIGPAACLLLLGAAGEETEVERALERARSRLRDLGAVWLGSGPGRHWQRDRFRHPYLRDGLLDAGYGTDTLETAAPWARVDRLYDAVRGALAEGAQPPERQVPVLCHLSHPYPDGVSLYFTFFFRLGSDPQATLARWADLKRRATDALVAAGGALSHHHGVGSWHAPWLEQETGPLGHRALGAVARELDPAGILNPHVLLDPEERLEL